MRCAGWTTEHAPLDSSRSSDAAGGASLAQDRSVATVLRCRMCGRGKLEAIDSVDAHRYFHCCHCDFTFAMLDGDSDAGSVLMSLSTNSGVDSTEINATFLRPALERLSHRKSLRILDYGGRDSIIPDLLRQAGHRVVAFDLMPGHRQHPDRISGDLLERNIPEAQFDLVYSYRVFEHLPEPAPVLRELLRLARPGGLILIHTDMELPAAEADAERWWRRIPPDVCALYRQHTFEVFLRGSSHRIIHHDPHTVIIQRDAA